jgi:hypothetical protein
MTNFKLRPDQVIAIRNSKLHNKELAYLYGVSHATIIDIKLGRSWANVGYITGPYRGRNRKIETKLYEKRIDP